MRKKHLFILLFIGLILFDNLKTTIIIKDSIGVDHKISLSPREIRTLKYFFMMLFQEQFAYTLNGSKPVSFASVKLYTFKKTLFTKPDPDDFLFSKGYFVWKTIEHHFNNSKFVLWFEPPVFPFPNSDTKLKDLQFFYIANKKNVLLLYEKHKHLFIKYADLNSLNENSLMGFIKNNNFFTRGLQKNELLKGLLLGFGLENATQFYLGLKDPAQHPKPFWDATYYRQVYEHGCNDKKSKLYRLISLPFFAGNSESIEGLTLKKEYLETRERTMALLEKFDFLTCVLTLLMQN